MTTLYRAIVMIVTGVIVVKGWQLYGPSTDQVKAGALRALEVAEDALDRSDEPAVKSGGLVADPREAAPPFGTTYDIAATAPPTTAPPLMGTQFPADQPNLSMDSSNNMPKLAAAEAVRLPALLTRLEGLGAADPQLAAWGSSGELYRFCCRANVGDSANLARHFESVAVEPLMAVEQVIAKLEAWRTAQRSERFLR
jgi:hypothetical protein